jgi:hypothetical protein
MRTFSYISATYFCTEVASGPQACICHSAALIALETNQPSNFQTKLLLYITNEYDLDRRPDNQTSLTSHCLHAICYFETDGQQIRPWWSSLRPDNLLTNRSICYLVIGHFVPVRAVA